MKTVDRASNQLAIRISKFASCAASVVAMCLSLLVLVGWFFNIEMLRAGIAGGAPLMPAVALSFFFCGT